MNIIKRNLKLIVGIIIGLIISGIGVYALSIASRDIAYDNTNSGISATNVQGALDELYSRANTVTSTSGTFTIYSAASDTIYYYNNGQKVDLCTTNNQGKGICARPSGSNVTLYSSVAKEPNNLSNPYSKTFSSISGTIYLMPSNTIYWYGYNNGLEDCTSANGWSGSISASNATTTEWNTNSVLIGNGKAVGTTDKHSWNRMHLVFTTGTNYGRYYGSRVADSKTLTATNYTIDANYNLFSDKDLPLDTMLNRYQITTRNDGTIDPSPQSNKWFYVDYSLGTPRITVYALYYE